MPGYGATAGPGERETLEAAVAALRRGEPIILPTDTVYGVAVLASVDGAIGALCTLKERSTGQPVAVLVSSAEQAHSLITAASPVAERLMATFWPGSLTLVLPRRPELAGLDLGGDPSTIGLRCPDHPLVHELARRLGPLATTSANRHGEPTPVTATAAAKALAGPVAIVIDGGVLDGKASTVVDCTTDSPRILREGAVAAACVRSVVDRRT